VWEEGRRRDNFLERWNCVRQRTPPMATADDKISSLRNGQAAEEDALGRQYDAVAVTGRGFFHPQITCARRALNENIAKLDISTYARFSCIRPAAKSLSKSIRLLQNASLKTLPAFVSCVQ
jgi:hypothetical protein